MPATVIVKGSDVEGEGSRGNGAEEASFGVGAKCNAAILGEQKAWLAFGRQSPLWAARQPARCYLIGP